MIYTTNKEGLINGGIPKDPRNREYKIVLEEVAAGTSTIAPYIQDVEGLRSEKIQLIKIVALKHIGNYVDALADFDMTMLVYKHLWASISNPSAELSAGKDVYDYAKNKISQAKTATREQLEGYDPATDNNWP
jgi:hypothetical protein